MRACPLQLQSGVACCPVALIHGRKLLVWFRACPVNGTAYSCSIAPCLTACAGHACERRRQHACAAGGSSHCQHSCRPRKKNQSRVHQTPSIMRCGNPVRAQPSKAVVRLAAPRSNPDCLLAQSTDAVSSAHVDLAPARGFQHFISAVLRAHVR